MVVAPRILAYVGLQVLSRDGMIYAANTALDQRPKALKRVNVRIAFDVDFSGVMNTLVAVSHSSQWIIDHCFVGKDAGARQYAFNHVRKQGARFYIWDNACDHAATTFNSAPHWSLADRATSCVQFLV